MIKFAALSIAALAASTAFAQAPSSMPAPNQGQQGVPGDMNTAGTATPGGDAATATPGGDASTATTAQADPAAGTAPASANAQVAAIVEAGFPKYDADKDGKLSDAEFKQWISDLKTAEIAAQGKPADAVAVTQYSSAALSAADKNKDSIVTKAELTSFLGG
jgi:hypothetical protein